VGPWPKRARGAAPVQGVRAWGIVGPQIGPRFPRHKPPPKASTRLFFGRSVLGRVFAPDEIGEAKGHRTHAMSFCLSARDRAPA
jgi:hypothetical protein